MPAETHSHLGPLGGDDVERVVREQLVEIFGVDPDAVTLDTRLREDLDADDFAVIDLVEGVIAELGERTVGFSIDDDDLVELRTVRDAVECALAGLRIGATFVSQLRRSSSLDKLEANIGVVFADRDDSPALARAPFVVRRERRTRVERAPRVPRRLRARTRRHALRVRALSRHSPRVSSRRCAAGVVNARVLAELAAELDLGAHLLLGKGEDAAGGRAKQSILADAFEAVVAAVYLDQGFAVARDLVMRCLSERIADAAAGPGGRDYKTRLQEATAARTLGRPRYVVRDEGPDHAKQFFAMVYVGDRLYGEGEGRSKKQAEQSAAWVACTRLQEEADGQGGDHAGAT